MKPHEIEHLIDHEMMRRRERVRALIAKEGTQEDVEFFDQTMRDLDTGITAARNAWHSMSEAQRRVLEIMSKGAVKLVRRANTRVYEAAQGGEAVKVATLATVRSLAARDLVQWEGGAFDPEAVASLTERGMFVAQKGRTET